MKNRCKHFVMRYAPPVPHGITGELEDQPDYSDSTYEPLATGVDRCSLCGHLQYYTNTWRQFYEEAIECLGGTHADYDLLQLKRNGAPITERDGRLQPVLVKAGTIQGSTKYFRGLFTKFIEANYDIRSRGFAFGIERSVSKPRFYVVPSEKGDIITWTIYVPRKMKSEDIIEIRDTVFDGMLFN